MSKVAFIIAIILCIALLYFGHPWIALVSFAGPTLAWVLTILGISGAGILTFLSARGAIPIVAGIGFLFTILLSIYSLVIK